MPVIVIDGKVLGIGTVEEERSLIKAKYQACLIDLKNALSAEELEIFWREYKSYQDSWDDPRRKAAGLKTKDDIDWELFFNHDLKQKWNSIWKRCVHARKHKEWQGKMEREDRNRKARLKTDTIRLIRRNRLRDLRRARGLPSSSSEEELLTLNPKERSRSPVSLAPDSLSLKGHLKASFNLRANARANDMCACVSHDSLRWGFLRSLVNIICSMPERSIKHQDGDRFRPE